LVEGIYTVVVMDSTGCSTTEQITVNDLNIDCDFFIYLPNAFTPNADGENDLLYLRGKGIESFTMVIYNRWGNKVFETSDINEGWDGTYKGKPLNSAVFVYVVNATFTNGETIFKKGDVSILK
jgi:gliding motility-associated-like protein